MWKLWMIQIELMYVQNRLFRTAICQNFSSFVSIPSNCLLGVEMLRKVDSLFVYSSVVNVAIPRVFDVPLFLIFGGHLLGDTPDGGGRDFEATVDGHCIIRLILRQNRKLGRTLITIRFLFESFRIAKSVHREVD